MAQYGDKSLSSLFGSSNAEGSAVSKFLPSSSLDNLGGQIESADYIRVELENKERVVPTVDFSSPINFAKYGSAEEYYKTSIERIYKTYPYDGSKKEKIQWSLSSSYLDNYIFEREYPRTNGFVNFSVQPKKEDTFNNFADGSESYFISTTPQYITVKGGPNQASLPIYEQGLNKEVDFKKPEHKANFYDTSINRGKNISIDGTTGNTIEFWFKNNFTSPITKALFDVWNGDGTNSTQPGSASYGRILIENRVAAGPALVDNSWFHVTYMSGTEGAERVPIYPAASLGAPVDNVWNHYAITIKNSGNITADKGLIIKTFLNGVLVDNKLTGSEVLEVKGSPLGGIDAYINAYQEFPTDYVKGSGITAGKTNIEGYGNLSASFDEFRFWKTARTERDIGTNWFSQIGAGTNTDESNTDLGFYFKFNEGVVGKTSLDQTILDYSGRVSNGAYINYLSANETTNIAEEGFFSRNIGSAIVSASVAEREFKDPIIYPTHPEVSSYKVDAMHKGAEWDYRNPSNMFNMLPSWIRAEDPDSGGNSKILTQIMSSYLDTLYLQIEEMKKIKTVRYLSSSIDTNVKPTPFASNLLTSAGFVAPEIFADIDVVAALSHRDDRREYERKLYDVKNYIYQNIYNNLTYINKSKGTTKAIRNLIRCFGIDEEIYKINMYSDNSEYDLVSNFQEKSIRKTYADFNHVQRHNATVYSYKNSSESGNFGFITGSLDTSNGFDKSMAMTVEAEVILPKKPPMGDPSYEQYIFNDANSSIFGMHTAKADDNYTDLTWDSNDFANFQVYAQSDATRIDERGSKGVKFILKSYNSQLPQLTSSLYMDQYQDTRWNFAVRVKPKTYPVVSSNPPITGSTVHGYDVEFEGYSTVSDIVINHFLATGSISLIKGRRFISRKKRLYVGAHRTNFTGPVREASDVLVSSCRYWADNITSEELKAHSIDPKSYGVQNPEKNAYLFVTKYDPQIEVPRINTLVLNWEFDTVTGSDGNGQFIVKDSSYTINQDQKRQLWEKDLSNLLDTNHDARGDFFELNNIDSTAREYIQAYSQQIPENINDSNMISIKKTDDSTFTKNTLPIKFSFAIEKSMYQTISEEILKFFYASKEASSIDNLIGDPINRYRINYKSMEKIRNIFFNTVGNVPDLEKYLNYYKWLDDSISEMVKQIVPVSANMPNVSNVIEAHMLDRGGKYANKFPSIGTKRKVIEGTAHGHAEGGHQGEEHGHTGHDPDAHEHGGEH